MSLRTSVKVEHNPISINNALAAPVEKTPVAMKASLPIRLTIAGIGVDATVKPVELTAEGDMAVDDNIDSVAWYRLGPEPGERGSAVIAGHYDGRDGKAAVFGSLHNLKVGDSVVVHDEANTEIAFVVRELREYNSEADATEVFRSSDGKAHLNLITCIGTWSKSNQSYTKRLVVFTDQVTFGKP